MESGTVVGVARRLYLKVTGKNSLFHFLFLGVGIPIGSPLGSLIFELFTKKFEEAL